MTDTPKIRPLALLPPPSVPRQRKVGRIVGYVLFAAIGALSVAALIGSVGLAILAMRWLVGLW
jgi:hypothetical protein